MADELETQTDESTEGQTAGDDTLVPIAELRKVRMEAANNRKALQEYKEKIKSQEEAARIAGLDEKSKLEELIKKAEFENKNLRESMTRVQIETAIISLSSKLGFTDPQDAVRFVDVSDVIGDDGNVDHGKIESSVKKIADDKPYLRSGSSRSNFGGPTNPSPPDGPKPRFTDQNNVDQMKKQATELTRQGRVGEATRLYNQAWELSQGIKK